MGILQFLASDRPARGRVLCCQRLKVKGKGWGSE